MFVKKSLLAVVFLFAAIAVGYNLISSSTQKVPTINIIQANSTGSIMHEVSGDLIARLEDYGLKNGRDFDFSYTHSPRDGVTELVDQALRDDPRFLVAIGDEAIEGVKRVMIAHAKPTYYFYSPEDKKFELFVFIASDFIQAETTDIDNQRFVSRLAELIFATIETEK